MILWFVPKGSERVKTSALVPDSVQLLDLEQCGFDSSVVHHQMIFLGPEGRRQYIRFSTCEDFFYPMSYGALLCLTLYLLGTYCLRRRAFTIAIAVIPLLSVLADYFENYHIVSIMQQFPAIRLSTIQIVSAANCIKWSTAYFSLALVPVLGIIALRKKIIGKKGLMDKINTET